MANPNMFGITNTTGNTTYVIPSTTAATVLLSNAASSGQVYKINLISCANVSGSNATTTVSINSVAAGGGTAYRLAYQITVPATASLIVTDKTTTFYLMENQSIVVTSGTGSAIEYVISYELLS